MTPERSYKLRSARFSGTMCYDPAGRAYVLPGSERFVGYLR